MEHTTTTVTPDPPENPPPRDRNPMEFAAIGMELAGITIGCLGIGWLIDRTLEFSPPYASACGVLVGFSFGMFRFIQRVRRS